MRILVLVLAIVLLPLRGWMGSAMALEKPAVPAVNAASQGVAADMTAAHCPEQAAAGQDAPDPASHHAQCAQCQLCHSAAATVAALAASAPVPAGALPLSPPARFASALPRLADKPPIG